MVFLFLARKKPPRLINRMAIGTRIHRYELDKTKGRSKAAA
jgi:hypothetical protein